VLDDALLELGRVVSQGVNKLEEKIEYDVPVLGGLTALFNYFVQGLYVLAF
jgi:hypothetical protein